MARGRCYSHSVRRGREGLCGQYPVKEVNSPLEGTQQTISNASPSSQALSCLCNLLSSAPKLTWTLR